MSTDTVTKNAGEEIILGKDFSTGKRVLGFISIAVIYFFYCYNFMVGTFIQPTMIATVAEGGFGFTLVESQQIFAVMSFATIPGTIIFSILASYIGKKYTMISIAVLIALTTAIPFLAPTNFYIWIVSRFCAGMVLGGVFGTAMPLAADMFPQKYRGKLAATLTALYSLAMIFGGQMFGLFGADNWQGLMMTVIIPPAVGAVLAFLFLPNDLQYAKELREIGKKTGEKINYLSMYKGKYLFIGIGVILLSGANFTAYSGFSNNATTYLVNEIQFDAALAGSIFSIQGFGQLAGYFAWGAIADKFGRKVPLIGMALSAVLVFVYTMMSADQASIFFVLSFLIGFAFGYSGAWGAYYTELFPSKYRSLSAGISFNGGRIVSTFAVPALAGAVPEGGSMTIIFYIAIGVFVAGTIVWALLPETMKRKGKEPTEAAA